MYYAKTDTPAHSRTTTLNEELGQVGWLVDVVQWLDCQVENRWLGFELFGVHNGKCINGLIYCVGTYIMSTYDRHFVAFEVCCSIKCKFVKPVSVSTKCFDIGSLIGYDR